MDKETWKRELLSLWHRDLTRDGNGPIRHVGTSAVPPGGSTHETATEDPGVFLKQTEKGAFGNRLFYPYSLAAVAACGLLAFTLIVIYALAWRRRAKGEGEEQTSSNILVYPAQQTGMAPLFLTKEIHFSLPPLRSTSLGDLADSPYDSDCGTDSLLLPPVGHSHRSNSFSCYGLGVIEPSLYKSTLDLDEIQWPEGHIGRLWFSLRYEPSTEKLLVSLLKAKNLPSRTIGTVNSCDPFVRLHLMPDERRYLQSKQKKKTCNPYFDETLVFQVSAKDMSDHTLKLTVIDGGRQKKKSVIGHATFPLKELEIGDGTEQQLFKMDLEKEPQEIKTDIGELLVSLVYNENLSRLSATVIEARGLKDLGKHKQEAHMCEIILNANDVRHTLIDLKKWAKPQKQERRLINILDTVYIHNDPYGVVLIIGAWNYPLLLTIGPLIGAIAAGNVVILKPSELAPNTAELLMNLLPKYLDPKCFQVYLGGIEETTELLNERFDYIFFTGSTAVGKIVHQAAAKHLTPTTLELGGKSPVYVDETADMEKTVKRILWGKLLNSGQTCVSPDYVLCSKPVQEQFLGEANKVLLEFYGSDPKTSPYLSKIVTDRHFKRLVDFIRPENVAIGGKFNAAERMITPTILVNVPADDPVMKEEIFGPILVIVNVKNVEEAISYINSREKPLALYIFSKNKDVQKAIVTRTSSGGITINDVVSHLYTENLPFGGVGSSGMGSYHGRQGFLTFSHQKGVIRKDFSAVSEMGSALRYAPYSDAKIAIMSFATKKRRALSYNQMKNIFIFCLGILVAYLVHLLWGVMKG